MLRCRGTRGRACNDSNSPLPLCSNVTPSKETAHPDSFQLIKADPPLQTPLKCHPSMWRLQHSRVQQYKLLVPVVASHAAMCVASIRSSFTEQILVPKLRIRFSDFPYLHSTKCRGFPHWGSHAEFGMVPHGIVL